MKRRYTRRLQQHIFDEIRGMKRATIVKEIANCGGMTTCNCGWLEYMLRGAVLEALNNELKLRDDKANARKVGNRTKK